MYNKRTSNSRAQSFNAMKNGAVIEHNIVKPNLVNQIVVQKPNGTMAIQYKVIKAEMHNARPQSINYMNRQQGYPNKGYPNQGRRKVMEITRHHPRRRKS